MLAKFSFLCAFLLLVQVTFFVSPFYWKKKVKALNRIKLKRDLLVFIKTLTKS